MIYVCASCQHGDHKHCASIRICDCAARDQSAHDSACDCEEVELGQDEALDRFGADRGAT